MEFTRGHRFRPSPRWPRADVLVLAGDIGTGGMARGLIEDRARHGPVVYVLGNHEFYGRDLPWVRRYWHELSDATENLHVLDGDLEGGNAGWVDLMGIRFLGTTLWSDTRGPLLRMNDYEQIAGLSQAGVYARHKSQTMWLERQLAQCAHDRRPCIVVTHHLPSLQCIPPAYKDASSTNRAYASPLDDLVGYACVRLWIHGHTHTSRDLVIRGTRVVCNPRGYRQDSRFENADFDASLCVDVDARAPTDGETAVVPAAPGERPWPRPRPRPPPPPRPRPPPPPCLDEAQPGHI